MFTFWQEEQKSFINFLFPRCSINSYEDLATNNIGNQMFLCRVNMPGLPEYADFFQERKNELGFTITKKVPDGVREIIKLMKSGIITDPYSEKFRNI